MYNPSTYQLLLSFLKSLLGHYHHYFSLFVHQAIHGVQDCLKFLRPPHEKFYHLDLHHDSKAITIHDMHKYTKLLQFNVFCVIYYIRI